MSTNTWEETWFIMRVIRALFSCCMDSILLSCAGTSFSILQLELVKQDKVVNAHQVKLTNFDDDNLDIIKNRFEGILGFFQQKQNFVPAVHGSSGSSKPDRVLPVIFIRRYAFDRSVLGFWRIPNTD